MQNLLRFPARLGAAFALLLGASALAPSLARAEDKVIKIATLAPDGSSWMKLLRTWAATVEQKSPGLKIKFFAGGVAGDERDAVRKMKLGQIHGAAVTGTGLGLIQPDLRVFELPFEWKNIQELDTVRDALDAQIRQKIADKNYVFLNWGDVGPVHLFTNIELKAKDDLPKTKMWEWSDDPLLKALFKELGLKGVALGVPDVLPSLQTGLIDACYGSPLSTLALQWNTKVKYMTKLPISQSIGAIVITKAAFDGLPPEAQKVLIEEGKALSLKMKQTVRDQDNARSLVKMQSLGLKVIDTPEPLVKAIQDAGAAVAAKLEGQVYTHEFRALVEKTRDNLRAGKK